MNAKELKMKGGEINFSNEEYQRSIGEDDIREATLTDHTKRMDRPNWARTYNIWFNGELMHSYKTFQSAKSKIAVLIDKWNLKEV